MGDHIAADCQPGCHFGCHGETMRASELDPATDYPSFPEFKKYGTPMDLIDADLILVLQRLRAMSGIPIIPSPDTEGWARTRGDHDSRHYAVDRLSDAGDIFPSRGRCLDLFLRAQQMQEIGGIGIYSDTRGPDGNPWPMIHIDLRPYYRKRTIWARSGAVWGRPGTYFVLGVDNQGFSRALIDAIKIDKE